MEYASQSGGAATGVLTITHTSGESLNAANVSIRGSGIGSVDGAEPDVTSPNTNWATATGRQEITAGDSVTVGVEADYDVSVIWESEDSYSILATDSGPAQ
jgi:type IV secretory pathway TrbL component